MDVVIAGGVESMTRVPIGLSTALPKQNGFGVYKSPAMEVRYPGVEFSQFTGAEMMARKYDLSRDELDAYSYESHRKAMAATQAGSFDDEIVPLEVELPDDRRRCTASTKGSASTRRWTRFARWRRCAKAVASPRPIESDLRRRSACLVVNERGLTALGVAPLARIHHLACIGHDPVIMLEAPIPRRSARCAKRG